MKLQTHYFTNLNFMTSIIHLIIKRWITKLQEYDNLALIPQFDSDMDEAPLRKASDIPSLLFLFKNYFQSANRREEGGKVYTDV